MVLSARDLFCLPRRRKRNAPSSVKINVPKIDPTIAPARPPPLSPLLPCCISEVIDAVAALLDLEIEDDCRADVVKSARDEVRKEVLAPSAVLLDPRLEVRLAPDEEGRAVSGFAGVAAWGEEVVLAEAVVGAATCRAHSISSIAE